MILTKKIVIEFGVFSSEPGYRIIPITIYRLTFKINGVQSAFNYPINALEEVDRSKMCAMLSQKLQNREGRKALLRLTKNKTK